MAARPYQRQDHALCSMTLEEVGQLPSLALAPNKTGGANMSDRTDQQQLTERELQSRLLNAIPPEGTTLSRLADKLVQDETVTKAGLDLLVSMGLIEISGELYRPTAFTQKAM